MELAIINGTYRDTTKPSAAVSQASASSRKLWDVCTAAYLCAVFGFRFHFLSRFQCFGDALEFLVTAAWIGFSGLFGFFSALFLLSFFFFFFFFLFFPPHVMVYFIHIITTVSFLPLPCLTPLKLYISTVFLSSFWLITHFFFIRTLFFLLQIRISQLLHQSIAFFFSFLNLFTRACGTATSSLHLHEVLLPIVWGSL